MIVDEKILATRRMLFSQTVWIDEDEVPAIQPGMSAGIDQLRSWGQSGKIFSVLHHGAKCYAAYQFDGTGRPLEIVREVLTTLGPGISSWGMVAWFHFPNQWIDAASDQLISPKDMLDMPLKVLFAATRYRGIYIA